MLILKIALSFTLLGIGGIGLSLAILALLFSDFNIFKLSFQDLFFSVCSIALFFWGLRLWRQFGVGDSSYSVRNTAQKVAGALLSIFFIILFFVAMNIIPDIL